MKRRFLVALALTATITAACADNTEETEDHNMSGEDHSTMNHSSDGKLPEGLANATSPTFAVGSQAMMTADHMTGMDGAEATIVGAYDTTVYAVSYTTADGEEVKNHKWVIHEELDNPQATALQQGDKVVLQADHMTGMDGAEATIDSAEQTTVYMVDYTSTDGEEVKNHKWVTEQELTANQ